MPILDAIVALDFGGLLELDVESPFEEGLHLALHLIAFAEGNHPLAEDAAGLVRVGIVADDFRGDREDDMETRWPNDSRGAGKRPFRRERRKG